MPIHFGPYELAECIGRGGMAAVYKANRRGAGGSESHVVVKTILPQLAKNSRLVRLFAEEARLSKQLHHHNIVRAHDAGFIGGKPFLEMEYLSGWNLQQLSDAVRKRGQRLPVSITLGLITQVCRGLAYAHSFVDEAGIRRPIIHRDVSPANIMICRDGSVKLLDFGLARVTRGETLSIDTFFGKLAYMSPEQLDRRQLDRRADVFALGALLHELLTGRSLFGGVDDGDTVRRVRDLAVDPPSVLNPAVPSALDAIVLRALMRDPEGRFSSAAEMLVALEGLGGAAAQGDLLSYLATVAPDVFANTCEECGAQIPEGVDCPRCKTQVTPLRPAPTVPPSDASATPPSCSRQIATPAAQCVLASRRRDATAWLRHLRVMLHVVFGYVQNWFEAGKVGACERAANLCATACAGVEQVRMLWACAWPSPAKVNMPAPTQGVTPPARRLENVPPGSSGE
jgi:serine/threonine protein kinase